ncbi:MAG TPA: DUF5916 domain-containing protein [Kofleriaceae bacterium]|nr:DUF5916 domain-containing protein [Kofleriaceae bacterium]
MKRALLVCTGFLVGGLTLVGPGAPSAAEAEQRVAHAVRVQGSIRVDGHLDDAAWQAAPLQADFWQRSPKEGQPPTYRTEFRVAYDDRAIYVALRAYDPDPAAIRARLHRRDLDSHADWMGVILDSYHDRRTAFGFAVNAAGVQRDVLLYDDSSEDPGWDAVWTSAVAIDAEGWTAELRIPLGQLRFSGKLDQVWGVQVMRLVGRLGEQSLWSPSPTTSQGYVSNFGDLAGIDGVRPGRRVELLPYVSGGIGHTPHDAGDPFHGAVDPTGNVGVDARIGVGSAFTIAATINPDFGQVEADPSQVNLTANETFFPEKRPFFLEGTDIFQFSLGTGDGDGSFDALFYSRRIGAAPHEEADGTYVDEPGGTTIYGAAKLSGKTASGWAVGVLEAVTGQESARIDDGAGTRTDEVVEPLTNYALARVKKDFRGGKTTLGAALTSVVRALDGTGLEGELHDEAITGGLQLSHRFLDDTWSTQLRFAGSWVHGSEEAITATQELVRHNYQRPDNDHLELDPTRTSLAGSALMFDVGRNGGKHWHYGVGSDVRTPGFEANDLGFQGGADYLIQYGFLNYREDQPSKAFANWRLNFNQYAVADFDGNFDGWGGNVNGNVQLTSFWGAFLGIFGDDNILDTGALRGGPALAVDPGFGMFGGFNSDGRKDVSFYADVNLGYTPSDHTHRIGIDFGASAQLRSNVELSLDGFTAWRELGTQYVDDPLDAQQQQRYLFATIAQRELSLTLRGSWTFTPDLSLQVYAQPFLSVGAYRGYKLAGDTHAARYADRFVPIAPSQLVFGDDVLAIDADGDGTSDFVIDRPDYDVRALRSTVVLRWQYRPGSSAYLIWSQDRESSTYDRSLQLGRDLAGMLAADAQQVLMLKVNYWFGA